MGGRGGGVGLKGGLGGGGEGGGERNARRGMEERQCGPGWKRSGRGVGGERVGGGGSVRACAREIDRYTGKGYLDVHLFAWRVAHAALLCVFVKSEKCLLPLGSHVETAISGSAAIFSVGFPTRHGRFVSCQIPLIPLPCIVE